MPKILELTADHVTTDAIGPPGKRVFYLHGWQEAQVVTLLVEKIQVQSLSIAIEQFLAKIQQEYPHLPEASPAYEENQMHITPPVDPLFRVGEINLGYRAEDDRVLLQLAELQPEGANPAEQRIVRFWCTRHQVRALAHWGAEVTSRGRPLCPQCGAPMDPEGHLCPKKNGHPPTGR